PTRFSGTIANGASSATVSITVSGDAVYENNESFKLILQAAQNGAADAVLGSALSATGIILNDDPIRVAAGQTVTSQFTLTGNDHLIVEQGGALNTSSTAAADPAIVWTGTGTNIVIDNFGSMSAGNGQGILLSTAVPAGGSLTFNNAVGARVNGL